MPVNENDIEILHMYVDGELPVAECEGLWRRMAVESDLAAELERVRSERSIRESVWAAVDPDPRQVNRLEERILKAARRHDVMSKVTKASRIVSTAAACVLIGFSMGWTGRNRFSNSNTAGLAPAGVQDISANQQQRTTVYIHDVSGHVIAKQDFASYDEARAFADAVRNAQAMQQQQSHDSDSMVVPAVGKF